MRDRLNSNIDRFIRNRPVAAGVAVVGLAVGSGVGIGLQIPLPNQNSSNTSLGEGPSYNALVAKKVFRLPHETVTFNEYDYSQTDTRTIKVYNAGHTAVIRTIDEWCGQGHGQGEAGVLYVDNDTTGKTIDNQYNSPACATGSVMPYEFANEAALLPTK